MADASQAQPGQLMKIGEIAARNIAQVLSLEEKHVSTIEHAIKDEINAMSSHFTLAFADIQTQYEIEVAKIKSSFNFVAQRPLFVGVAALVVFVVGAAVGKLV